MKLSSVRDQSGIAHVALIAGVLLVLGIIGFAGYTVMNGQKKDASSLVTNAATKAAVAEACKDADENICKFMASYTIQKYYTVKSSQTAEGKTSTTTYRVDGDKQYHMISTDPAYETIRIDNVTYFKAGNGTWWKQKDAKVDTPTKTDDFKPKFVEEKTSDTPEAEETKTTYKSLGKEACGDLQCHKYQVLDSGNTETTEYIWFDTKDYQLRRMLSETKDYTTDQLFSYDKVSIKAPSPVKEMGPNQYLMPGDNEPQTVPDAASIQQSMNDFTTEAAASNEE